MPTTHKPATPLPESWLDLPQSISEPVAKELIRRSNAYPKLIEALRALTDDANRVREAAIVNNARKANGMTAQQMGAALTTHSRQASALLRSLGIAALRDMTNYDSVSQPGAYGHAIENARALLRELGEDA